MKSIDVKSLLIGALLTTTIILGCSATGTSDKWDDQQEWSIRAMDAESGKKGPKGYEPFAWQPSSLGNLILWRKRIK